MPLTNFGALLNFAEEIERQDKHFYEVAAANPACAGARSLFALFIKDGEKNIQTVRRTRRENVTEMILEGIQGFTRAPFMVQVDDPAAIMEVEAVLAAARQLEVRALRYYQAAAEKIKALPEVARALKSMAKKRAAHLSKLEG
jgi:rubrerythrin